MKALSVRQPWAWALLQGKPVENRTWPTKYRGPFYIHASKAFDVEGWIWIKNNQALLNLKAPLPHPNRMKKGGIIGRGNITDCVSEYDSPWFFGPFGFVTTENVPLPFHARNGRLNFFNVDYPSGDQNHGQ